jgi:hypothetical protein
MSTETIIDNKIIKSLTFYDLENGYNFYSKIYESEYIARIAASKLIIMECVKALYIEPIRVSTYNPKLSFRIRGKIDINKLIHDR